MKALDRRFVYDLQKKEEEFMKSLLLHLKAIPAIKKTTAAVSGWRIYSCHQNCAALLFLFIT